jgi:hypothetical protein
MPLLHDYLFDQLLVPALFIFFLIAALFALAFGLGLIVFRTRAFRSLGPMDHWVSARKSLAPFETRREIEPFVYQHRRWFSVVFIVGGLFSGLMLSGKVPALAVARLFGVGEPHMLSTWVVESLGVLMIAGSMLAVVIGVLLGFFPPQLRALESKANRWVSSRKLAKGADQVHLPLDRWFHDSPRTAGCLLAVAALFLAFNSTVALLARS